MRSCLLFAVPLALAVPLSCGGQVFEAADGAADDSGAAGDGSEDRDVADSNPADTAIAPDGGGDEDSMLPPPPMCPIAATIQNGDACTQRGLLCQSASPIYACTTQMVVGYQACTCLMGNWVCGPRACVDAGGPPPPCPLPRLVNSGVSCPSAGQQCPGNPRSCHGAIFNDAFQCSTMGTWTLLAATNCPDGG
jgi:hypothetical protein